MATILKYRVIKNKHQYLEYTQTLEQLVALSGRDQNTKDEVDLLTVLIEKWDAEHNSFQDADPIRLLLSLMRDHNLKAKDIVEILGISKSYVSDILHYKKGLSKDVIRKLAKHFKVSQEAFNRPYKLKSSSKSLSRSRKSATRKKTTA